MHYRLEGVMSFMSRHVCTMTYMNTATRACTATWAPTYGLRAEHMYVKKDDMSSEAARAHCTSGSPKRTYKHVASLKHVDRFSLKQLNSPASAECRMQVCRTSGCGVPTCG